MNVNELDIKIVEEVRKEDREYLYRLSHMSYRNTCLKQNTWRTISTSVGLTQTETMRRWRALRTRYMKLNKPLKSGSAAIPKNSRDEWLLRELDFLKNEIITEPTVSSFQTNVTRPTVFQDLLDITADEIIEDFCPTDFNIDESPPLTIATSPKPPVPIATSTITSTATSRKRMAEPTPGSSNCAEPTSSAISSQRSARRQPSSKKKKEPEDSTINKICDTIMQQQQVLQTLAQPEAPTALPINTCLLKVFAETWPIDFSKWPRSMQTKFIHNMTVSMRKKITRYIHNLTPILTTIYKYSFYLDF